MKPFIELFGHSVPIYGICYFLGVFAAAGAAVLLAPKARLPRYDIVCSAIYSVLAGGAGAKLLFIAVSWRQIVELDVSWDAVLKGGFVFYGGLFGGIVGLLIYCKQFKMSFITFADLYAVVLPLGHACGRIGCYFAGCCYGMEYAGPLSVTYYTSLGNTPVNVPLLPVQLIEATGLLCIFAVLLTAYCIKRLKPGTAVSAYMISYAVLRFTVEFFRGDQERGAILGLSTSQWGSIILFAAGVAVFFRHFAKNNAD